MSTLPDETYRLAFPSLELESPVYVSFGRPYYEACAHHVKNTFDAKRVYIVASGSLSKNTDALQQLTSALGERVVGVKPGFAPHTPWSDVIDATKDALDMNADCVITLGGGSLSDGAKAMLLFMANNITTVPEAIELGEKTELGSKNLREVVSKHSSEIDCISPKIPLICIPTTLSAAEYTKFAALTHPDTNHKMIFGHPWCRPRLVVIDPALTKTTPEWVWLSTGVRGIDHCVEGYCRIEHPDEDLDKATLDGLKLILPSLLITKEDPSNDQARLNTMLGIYPVTSQLDKGITPGASHGIGHQLGPFGVGHGETSCILLPSVMKWNKRVNAAKQERIKQLMWNDETVAKVLRKRGLKEDDSDAGDALDGFFRELGMPRSLKERGVGREHFDLLAENSLRDPSNASNPIPLRTKEQVIEILEMCAE